jgi:hypothetical protein
MWDCQESVAIAVSFVKQFNYFDVRDKPSETVRTAPRYRVGDGVRFVIPTLTTHADRPPRRLPAMRLRPLGRGIDGRERTGPLPRMRARLRLA